MEVKSVPSLGWTQRSAGISVLLAMEEHRRHAGLRLVQLRELRRWSQEDLAAAAKVSVKTVSRFENGRHDGRRSTVRAFAKALEVSEADIIGEPPVPLGLDAGPTQLDRVEQKLDAILALLLTMEKKTPPGDRMRALMQGEAVRQAHTQADEAPPEADAATG